MKKLILLLLLIPLVSFGQNDFRKMFFGESKEVLKEKYPDVDFTTSIDQDVLLLTHTDDVLGFSDCIVQYAFKDNKLFAGIYMFNPYEYENDEKLKDFNIVSKRLNDKYTIIRNEEWYKKDSYLKGKPDELGYAIGQGYVDLVERAYKDKDSLIRIAHTLTKDNHQLLYILEEGLDKVLESYDDDI